MGKLYIINILLRSFEIAYQDKLDWVADMRGYAKLAKMVNNIKDYWSNDWSA